MIARHKHHRRTRSQVADRERKHPIQALDAIRPFFFVEMQHNLGVGVGDEAVSLALEFPAQIAKL